MYNHIIKGWTVGHVLTRRILRGITGVPGAILDLIVALFWLPEYRSYWDNHHVKYADGTRVGVLRGATGWIGELLGFVIGAPIGALLGTVLYFPDLLLRGIIYLHQQINNGLNALATFIGQIEYLNDIAYPAPRNFMQKAWNLSIAFIGLPLAAIPFVLAKIIEFFIPFIKLSYPLTFLITGLSGLFGFGAAVALYLPVYLVKKTVDLISLFRNTVHHVVEFISAQTHVEDDDYILPHHEGAHSNGVFQNNNMNASWKHFLSGPLKTADSGQPSQSWEYEDEDGNALEDPITLEPLGAHGVPVLIDPHKHKFNDDKGIKGVQGIRFWLSKHKTCPLSGEEMFESDLKPFSK